jgi:hypothetical protein
MSIETSLPSELEVWLQGIEPLQKAPGPDFKPHHCQKIKIKINIDIDR